MSKMNQVYGLGQGLISSLPPPVLFGSAPTAAQNQYEIGQIAYTGSPGAYTFYIYAGVGVWELLDVSTGVLDTLTGDSGTAVPTAGNIKIAGTAAQVSSVASGSTVTLSLIGPYTPATYTTHGVLIGEGATSIVATATGSAGQVLTSGGALTDPTWTTATFPSTAGSAGTILRSDGTNWVTSTDTYPNTSTAGALIAATATNTIGQIADVAVGQVLASGGVGVIPAYTGSPSVTGSITAGTTITATSGAITASAGNLVLGTAGNKLVITTGSNASCGVSGNMSGSPGAIAVATTACTTSSVILFSRATTGGTPGQVSITAQSTSGFTLTSTGNESSTFNWLIIN